MRTYRSVNLWIILATLICLGLAVPAAKADSVTYNYTGNTFTTCTYGPCPSGFTSDYLTASLTFSTALPDNLLYTNTSAETAALSTLTGWTVKDALGNFSYSSATTPTYLTGSPSDLAPPLALSTDSNGNIVAWVMIGLPAEVLNISGASQFFILSPAVTDPQSPVPIADGVEIATLSTREWDAVTSTPGTWSVPEPSTLLLTLSGISLLVLMAWKFRVQPSS